MTEYFVYCEYSKNSPHTAIFIPYNTNDEELQDDIKKITKLGSKIQRVYQTNGSYIKNTNFIINGTIDDSQETTEIINKWSSLLFHIDHDYDNSYPSGYFCYYINDENQYLSPNELYDYLKSLQSFNEMPLIIKDCVIVSDNALDTPQKAVLRFFLLSEDKIQSNELVQKLSAYEGFSRIMPASDNNGISAGYGFIELKRTSDYSLFKNKSLTINGIDIVFQ